MSRPVKLLPANAVESRMCPFGKTFFPILAALAVASALMGGDVRADDLDDDDEGVEFVGRVELGSLVLENIPPIPDDIAATLFQYQQARAASFAGWLPAPQGILITTRFGQTRQVHHVRDPGGDRQQLTFFPEPINNVAELRPGAPGFLFGKDQGGDEHYQIYYQDLGTGRQKRLTQGRARNTAPRWSNLGEYFAYSTTQRNGRDTDIHIYDMSRGESRPVLERSGLVRAGLVARRFAAAGAAVRVCGRILSLPAGSRDGRARALPQQHRPGVFRPRTLFA
jgi:hypothetical protein